MILGRDWPVMSANSVVIFLQIVADGHFPDSAFAIVIWLALI